MSSYLNFYLLPKKKKEDTIDPKPLLLNSISRADPIYQHFGEELNPLFSYNAEDVKYMELTPAMAREVTEAAEKDLLRTKTKLMDMAEAYRHISPEADKEEAISDYMSTKEYIREMEETLSELKVIANWVSDLEYSDFEKVLINID